MQYATVRTRISELVVMIISKRDSKRDMKIKVNVAFTRKIETKKENERKISLFPHQV